MKRAARSLQTKAAIENPRSDGAEASEDTLSALLRYTVHYIVEEVQLQ